LQFKASLGKKGLMEWLKVLGPEFKPQYWKKKKKERILV
jgi:hypothetical protein